MKPSLESILLEALRYEAPAFNHDEEVDGGDLLQWFGDWRRRAASVVRHTRHSSRSEDSAFGFHHHLSAALRALKAFEHHPQCESSQSTYRRGAANAFVRDQDCRYLIDAVSNGGLRIMLGEYCVTVFKHPVGEGTCTPR